MKKNASIVILLICSIFIAYSQTDSSKFNLYSKKGFYYFPEKGDWSLSISATPFFDYLGNVMGDNQYYYYDDTFYYPTESPTFAFTAQNPGTIYLKYFYDKDRAYRLKLMFGYSSNKDKMGSGSENPDEIYLKETALALGLYFGKEYYFPLKSRIRAYCGYEVGAYTLPYVGELYENSDYQVVGNVEFVDGSANYNNFTEKGGSTFGLMGAGLIGAEWFFAAKISLGGEMGLGFNYSNTGKRKYETESTKLIIDSGESNFSLEPFASGDLILHIYF